MSENTTTEETVPTTLTSEDIEKGIASLPDFLASALRKVNADIAAHNAKVVSLQSADKSDPKLIKAEIFEQQYESNPKLKKLRDAFDKASAAIEQIVSQAYEVIEKDGLMPKELSEDEQNKLKSETQDSNKELKSQVAALLKFEDMAPDFKGKLAPLVSEIKTRRGTAKAGSSSSQSGVKRPRFKRIEVNGQVEDDKGNKVFGIDPTTGEPKFTFTFASQYLRKQHKDITWTQTELGEAYFAGQDADNLPDEHTFVMPFTYKSEDGNEHTVTYEIKTIR